MVFGLRDVRVIKIEKLKRKHGIELVMPSDAIFGEVISNSVRLLKIAKPAQVHLRMLPQGVQRLSCILTGYQESQLFLR